MSSTRSLSSTRFIRSFNVASILQALYREGSATRARLTRLTQMSPATVTRIVAQLIDRQIIVEKGTEQSTGGRRPITLQLNHSKLYVLGAQLMRDQSGVALSDLQGRIIARKLFRPYSLEPRKLVSELAGELHRLLEREEIDFDHLLGLGLAVSGIVDSEQSSIVRSVNLGWQNVPVGTWLAELVDVPLFIENDANAAAMAEMWFGLAQGIENFMYIKTGTGVGSAVVYRGRLITGNNNMAGEIGHIPLMARGRRCRCGQSGCLETYLYVPDVINRYQEEGGQAVSSIDELFERYGTGDALADMLIDEASEALGLHVTFAGVLLDLDMVVIGGAWGRSEVLLRKVESIYQDVLESSGLTKKARVLGSRFGDDSDLRGATGLVIDRLFAHPQLV